MKLIKKIKDLLCEHTFVSDNQIRVVKCTKCDRKYWYSYDDIYRKDNVQQRKNKIANLSY